MEKIFDDLYRSTITGKVMNVVNIGGIVKYFKSWRALSTFMKKTGYTWDYTDPNGGWSKTRYSKDEIWLKEKFTK